MPCTRADTYTLYASIRHPPSIHPYKVHVHASFCTCMHLARMRAPWCTCPRAATLPCAFFPACHRFSRRGSCEVGNRCVADPAICSCALLLAVCTCYGARLRFFLLFVNKVQCDERCALCFRILCAHAHLCATVGVLAPAAAAKWLGRDRVRRAGRARQ